MGFLRLSRKSSKGDVEYDALQQQVLMTALTRTVDAIPNVVWPRTPYFNLIAFGIDYDMIQAHPKLPKYHLRCFNRNGPLEDWESKVLAKAASKARKGMKKDNIRLDPDWLQILPHQTGNLLPDDRVQNESHDVVFRSTKMVIAVLPWKWQMYLELFCMPQMNDDFDELDAETEDARTKDRLLEKKKRHAREAAQILWQHNCLTKDTEKLKPDEVQSYIQNIPREVSEHYGWVVSEVDTDMMARMYQDHFSSVESEVV